jgi:hypothetical protein
MIHSNLSGDSGLNKVARSHYRRKPRRLCDTVRLSADVKNFALTQGRSNSCFDSIGMKRQTRSSKDQHAIAFRVSSREANIPELRRSGDKEKPPA